MTVLELNHIALYVADLEASIHFYSKVLGLPVLPRPDFGFPGAWFRLGLTQELHLIVGRTEPVHNHHRQTHFALLVPSVAKAATHAQAHGIPSGNFAKSMIYGSS